MKIKSCIESEKVFIFKKVLEHIFEEHFPMDTFKF